MTSSTAHPYDEPHSDTSEVVRQEHDELPGKMLASPTRTRL